MKRHWADEMDRDMEEHPEWFDETSSEYRFGTSKDLKPLYFVLVAVVIFWILLVGVGLYYLGPLLRDLSRSIGTST